MMNPMVLEIGKEEVNSMLVVTLTGLLIVFSALILLIGIISIYGKAVSSAEKKPKKKSEPAKSEKKLSSKPAVQATAVKASAPQQKGGNDEIIAVIAAAVAAYGDSEGKKYAVRSVRKAAAQTGRSAWASAGVMENTRSFVR